MSTEYYGLICPSCQYQTTVDPALVKDEDPMPYCPECGEPLFTDNDESFNPTINKP